MAIFRFLLPCFLLACAAERAPGELFGPAVEQTLVLDAILLVGHPLPDLFVRRTLGPKQTYSLEQAGVRDAVVLLQEGDRDFPYRADPDSAGRYLPPENPPLVAPQTAYTLVVRTASKEARATTTTPNRLKLRQAVLLDDATLEDKRVLRLFGQGEMNPYAAPENQLNYREGVMELRLEPIDAVAFQLALFNLETDSPSLIDEDFLEEDDIQDFERQGNSPPLEAVDNRVRLPWFAVAFAGRHLFKVYALDQNWYDYARTNNEGGGFFGGLIGDNFEEPIFNIEGGIGLFGSAALDSLGFVVEPRSIID